MRSAEDRRFLLRAHFAVISSLPGRFTPSVVIPPDRSWLCGGLGYNRQTKRPQCGQYPGEDLSVSGHFANCHLIENNVASSLLVIREPA
jgi:hypothetical protein